MPNDHKQPKFTKKQQELAQLLRYIDERFQNQTEQIRAIAIACGISPEDFQAKFVDTEAQDQFYIRLHAAEDNYEFQKKKELAEEEDAKLGKSSTPTLSEPANIDGAIAQFAPPALSEPETVQSDQG